MRLAGRQRRPDRAALFTAVVLAALGIGVGLDAGQMTGGGYARVGPSAFPYAIAGGLVMLSLWTAVVAWRGDLPERPVIPGSPVAWIIGGLVAQMLLLNVAGFSIATGLLFAATARAFGKRQLLLSIPMGIVICLAVWMIFSKLLRLKLPAGPLEGLLP
jgi:putative tricarboxylic transport membrane protein